VVFDNTLLTYTNSFKRANNGRGSLDPYSYIRGTKFPCLLRYNGTNFQYDLVYPRI
jgi:hypothetical protein